MLEVYLLESKPNNEQVHLTLHNILFKLLKTTTLIIRSLQVISTRL